MSWNNALVDFWTSPETEKEWSKVSSAQQALTDTNRDLINVLDLEWITFDIEISLSDMEWLISSTLQLEEWVKIIEESSQTKLPNNLPISEPTTDKLEDFSYRENKDNFPVGTSLFNLIQVNINVDWINLFDLSREQMDEFKTFIDIQARKKIWKIARYLDSWSYSYWANSIWISFMAWQTPALRDSINRWEVSSEDFWNLFDLARDRKEEMDVYLNQREELTRHKWKFFEDLAQRVWKDVLDMQDLISIFWTLINIWSPVTVEWLDRSSHKPQSNFWRIKNITNWSHYPIIWLEWYDFGVYIEDIVNVDWDVFKSLLENKGVSLLENNE